VYDGPFVNIRRHVYGLYFKGCYNTLYLTHLAWGYIDPCDSLG